MLLLECLICLWSVCLFPERLTCKSSAVTNHTDILSSLTPLRSLDVPAVSERHETAPLKRRTVHFAAPDSSSYRSESTQELSLRRSKRLKSTTQRARTPALSDYDAEATDDMGTAPTRIPNHGNPLLIQPIMDDSTVPTRTLESFQWLLNTYHRDLVDQLEYQTIKVYITSCNGDKFIVVDRLHIDKAGHKSTLGDTKRIHARDVEEYTLAYNAAQAQVLQVALTVSEPDVSESLLRFLHALPPLHDPMREFVLVTGLIVLPDIKTPKTHKMAMKSPEAAHWRLAEQAELDSMTKHDVFTQMVLPAGKKAIDTRWVYALKYKDGVIYKYKARLVAKGYEQIYGVDFEETFAPVARLTSLRIVLAISAKLQLDVQQMDVETAFLNAPLAEEVYIRIPDGVTVATGCNCIRLNKALYGLKQSPREWYDNINSFLQSLNFKRLQSEHCLYIYTQQDEICLISLYVDDLIIAGTDTRVTTRVKECLKRRYSMKDLGNVDEILGCRVHVNHTLGIVTMDQTKYTSNILSKFLEPTEQTWLDTPADSSIILTQDLGPLTEEETISMRTVPYREVIGCLLWLSLGTRPDITYAVSQVAKFSANPGQVHWKAVKRILRYLHGTRNMGLIFRNLSPTSQHIFPHSITSLIPVGFVDADYARDISTRRSCTGFVFFLAEAPISWQTRQQPSVALSTMESEFMAACAAAQESLWLLQLLKEFGTLFTVPITIYEDNKACLDYSKNPTSHQRTKHISVRYHFIRDLITAKTIQLLAIPSADNIADIFTKPLDKRVFQHLRGKFMHVL